MKGMIKKEDERIEGRMKILKEGSWKDWRKDERMSERMKEWVKGLMKGMNVRMNERINGRDECKNEWNEYLTYWVVYKDCKA